MLALAVVASAVDSYFGWGDSPVSQVFPSLSLLLRVYQLWGFLPGGSETLMVLRMVGR